MWFDGSVCSSDAEGTIDFRFKLLLLCLRSTLVCLFEQTSSSFSLEDQFPTQTLNIQQSSVIPCVAAQQVQHIPLQLSRKFGLCR